MRHAYQIVASFVAMLLLGLSLATPSNAQNEAFEAAEQVPAGIDSVIKDGFWTLGKDEGFSGLSLSRAASSMYPTATISSG